MPCNVIEKVFMDELINLVSLIYKIKVPRYLEVCSTLKLISSFCSNATGFSFFISVRRRLAMIYF